MAKKKNIKHIIGGGKGTHYMASYQSDAIGDTMAMPEKAKKEYIKFNQQQEVDKLKFDAQQRAGYQQLSSTVIKPIIQAQEGKYARDILTRKLTKGLDISVNTPGKYGIDY